MLGITIIIKKITKTIKQLFRTPSSRKRGGVKNKNLETWRLGANFKKIRQKKGISLRMLSKETKITKVTICSIEAGRTNTTFKTFLVLCRGAGIDICLTLKGDVVARNKEIFIFFNKMVEDYNLSVLDTIKLSGLARTTIKNLNKSSNLCMTFYSIKRVLDIFEGLKLVLLENKDR